MSRTAQIGVKAPHGEGSTWINLTYNYWSDNTWYCPAGAKIGASSGTWDVGRITTGMISLYKGDKLIASGASLGVTDSMGYPFNDDLKNLAGTFQCFSKDAAWYLGAYVVLGLNEVKNCIYWFNKI